MRKRNECAIVALIALLGSSAACAREGDVAAQNVDAATAPERRLGLYAFDGTNTDASKNSVIHQIHSRAELRTKGYFEGTDLAGSTVRDIIEAGKARVCNDWRAGKIDAVALTGYSRGAIIALAVAHELLQVRGNGQPEGCDNVDARRAGASNGLAVLPRSVVGIHAYIERTDKPTIAHLALLDAVNTLNADLGKELPAQVKALSPSTRCFHLTKANPNEHVLTTLDLQGCDPVADASGARHQALAQLPAARVALEASLAREGIVFRDVPDISALPPADYRPLCSLVKASSPEANDGYGRCVKAGCSWQGSPAGPGPCAAPERVRVQAPEGLPPVQ